jgi:hypothetical protein
MIGTFQFLGWGGWEDSGDGGNEEGAVCCEPRVEAEMQFQTHKI